MRKGLKNHSLILLVMGGGILSVYGITVNLPKWDFGRLLGVYISIFFVVSQLIAYFVFHEKINASVWLGGSLIILGGIALTIGQIK